MPVRIENLDALQRSLTQLASMRNGGAQVVARSKSTLRRRLPPEAKRYITAKFNIAPTNVSKRLRCVYDTSSVSLIGFGIRTYLRNFAGRQNSKGVEVSIVKGQTMQLPHVFMRSPGGYSSGRSVDKHATALVRLSVAQAAIDAGGGWISVNDLDAKGHGLHEGHGYPIGVLLGPSVGDMLAYADTEDRLVDFAQQTFAGEVDRLIEVANGQ